MKPQSLSRGCRATIFAALAVHDFQAKLVWLARVAVGVDVAVGAVRQKPLLHRPYIIHRSSSAADPPCPQLAAATTGARQIPPYSQPNTSPSSVRKGRFCCSARNRIFHQSTQIQLRYKYRPRLDHSDKHKNDESRTANVRVLGLERTSHRSTTASLRNINTLGLCMKEFYVCL